MKTRLILSLLLASIASAADVTITGLPAISNVTASTIVPVVDVSGTATTKKATVGQLVSGLPAASSTVVGTMSTADKIKLDAATSNSTASTLVIRDSSGNFTGNIITANTVTGLASPSTGTDAANKSYVDAAAAGIKVHDPVVAATVGSDITLSGGAPNTLDGVTLASSSRVLVKDQTDNKQNGIYYVTTLGSGSNGTWTRSTDADTGAELSTGSYVFVTGGTININAAYSMTTAGTITIGSSPIVWTLYSQIVHVNASSITGVITKDQIATAAIDTAKFATGITPVELLASLPVSGNFAGRMVFLTSDSKLYRYNGVAFIASIPTTDLSGQISAGQLAANSVTAGTIATNAVTAGTIAANAVTTGTIAAGAINTAQLAAGAVNTSILAANSVTSDKIVANTITASDIAANTITAGQIAAGTITGNEIAANAITSDKIAANTITAADIAANTITAAQIASGTITANQIASNTITSNQIATGTITADRLSVSNLSAITANLGTVTAGNITGVNLSGSTFTTSGVNGNLTLSGTTGLLTSASGSSNIWIGSTDPGTGTESRVDLIQGLFTVLKIRAASYLDGGVVAVCNSTGTEKVRMDSPTGLTLSNSSNIVLGSNSTIKGPGSIDLNAESSTKVNIQAGETGTAGTQIGYWRAWLNGRQVLIPIYNVP